MNIKITFEISEEFINEKADAKRVAEQQAAGGVIMTL